MSLPMAHGLAGVGIHFLMRPKNDPVFRASSLGVAFLVPVLPDLDFLLEWFLPCDPVICRRSFTHSFFTALAVTLLVTWLIAKGKSRREMRHHAAYFFLLVSSHAIVDFFAGPNSRLPSGVMLFYPLSSDRFAFSVALLPNVPVFVTGPEVLLEHWDRFLFASLAEALYFIPVLAVIFFARGFYRLPLRFSLR